LTGEPSRQSSNRRNWSLVSIGIAGILLIVLAGLRFDLKRFKYPSAASDMPQGPSLELLEQSAAEVLVAHHLSWFESDEPGFNGSVWSVQVPADLPIPAIHLEIQESIERIGGCVHTAESEPADGRVTLHIGPSDTCLFKTILWPIRDLRSRQGRIAILIDDFGDRWDAFTESFLHLDIPLSISIIPGLRYSDTVREEALKCGCEVLLHLPMQPKGSSFQDHPLMIREAMTESEIQKVLEKSFERIAGVSGVNNHMGSLITENRRIMKHVLREVKKHNLYFLDSRTTAETVAYDVSLELDVPAARRDVFLDTDRTDTAIRSAISRLAELAENRGAAIGIGHGNQLTLVALREQIPELKEQGFEFVRISDIVR